MWGEHPMGIIPCPWASHEHPNKQGDIPQCGQRWGSRAFFSESSNGPRQSGQGHVQERSNTLTICFLLLSGLVFSLIWVKNPLFIRSTCSLTVRHQCTLYLCHSELKIKPIKVWFYTPPWYLISLMSVFKNKICKEATAFSHILQ